MPSGRLVSPSFSQSYHTRGSRRASKYAVPVAAASRKSSCSPKGNVVISSNKGRWPPIDVARVALQPEAAVLDRDAERRHPGRLVLRLRDALHSWPKAGVAHEQVL